MINFEVANIRNTGKSNIPTKYALTRAENTNTNADIYKQNNNQTL